MDFYILDRFTYLIGTSDYELMIGCIKCGSILGFDDSDYADLNNRKFTTMYVFFCSRRTLSLKYARQYIVAMSTMEAE